MKSLIIITAILFVALLCGWLWGTRKPKGRCYDCGLQYGGPGWIEAIIPNAAWEMINPSTSEGGGLLCINCISKRLALVGFQNREVPVWLVGLEPLQARRGEPGMKIFREWKPKEKLTRDEIETILRPFRGEL